MASRRLRGANWKGSGPQGRNTWLGVPICLKGIMFVLGWFEGNQRETKHLRGFFETQPSVVLLVSIGACIFVVRGPFSMVFNKERHPFKNCERG